MFLPYSYTVRSPSGKSPAIVNIREWFAQHWCNLAAKDNGLECAGMNKDDFTIFLVGAVVHMNEHVYCVAITSKMTEQVEQWICIKFCIKLEHSSTETIQMIQKAFREDAMNVAQIKVWHKCFKDAWESVESDPCSGSLQQEHLRMLNMYGLQSTKICDGQCEN